MKNLIQRFMNSLGYEMRRKNSRNGFWSTDRDFLDKFGQIDKHTLVSIDRCYMLYQFAKHTKDIPGAMAEVGVYKGGTAKLLAETAPSKKLYLFDTFEGLPESELKLTGKVNKFDDVRLDGVKEFLKEHTNVIFKKGFFPDTGKGLENEKFSLVYLDADIYESIRDGLNFFFPRLSRGGVIVVDDYKSGHWPGVEKAVSEFARRQDITPIMTTNVQCVVINNKHD
jgi:O-methyltransferase